MQTAPILRGLIALSFAVFGVEHLASGAFPTRVVPGLPAWVPWQPLWAYATGLLLCAAAPGVATRNRRAAILLGAGCLVAALTLHLPRAVQQIHNGGLWTGFGKGLTLAACAFIAAGPPPGRRTPLDHLAPLGKYFLASFMMLCGAEHFIYRDFVASLLPPWIPWHYFWTDFAGVALIAGGTGIMVPITTRLALLMSGLMILSWVPLVHIPLAIRDRNYQEFTPVFEALAFGSAAVLAARTAVEPMRVRATLSSACEPSSDSRWSRRFSWPHPFARRRPSARASTSTHNG